MIININCFLGITFQFTVMYKTHDCFSMYVANRRTQENKPRQQYYNILSLHIS